MAPQVGLEATTLRSNSLVGFRNFNNFAAQMTTHEGAQMQAIHAYVTVL